MRILEKLVGMYHHKGFPRVFYTKPDGGKDSGVTGWFLVEWKPFISVGVLRFRKGSREAYHTHAFNAITFWLKGCVTEEKYMGEIQRFSGPSLIPKFTPRDNCHKVIAEENAWALTFRGPWVDFWKEYKKGKQVILTHGRRVVGVTDEC